MYGSGPAAGAGQAIFTDDVSLQVFMEHLKRLTDNVGADEVKVSDGVVMKVCACADLPAGALSGIQQRFPLLRPCAHVQAFRR